MKGLISGPYGIKIWLQAEGSRDDERCDRMDRVNPKYLLRNCLAQIVIENAQRQDFSEIDRPSTLLQEPFKDQPGMETYALSLHRIGASL
ncbi:MAG: hypothetical protein U0223_11335 [Nitrospira sp.]|nr:hypothetical protein [Nitrospira sp.]